MKIRLSANEVRVRVSKSDVETLKTLGKLSLHLPVPCETMWHFVLEGGLNDCIVAKDNQIVWTVSSGRLQDWLECDTIALNCAVETAQGKIHYLLEKDLKCTTPKPSCTSDDAFEWPKTSEKS